MNESLSLKDHYRQPKRISPYRMLASWPALLMIAAAHISCEAQEVFEYGPAGLEPKAVITEVPGKTQGEIFTMAMNWIKETYRDPDEVIKATIDTQMIRMHGITAQGVCVKNSLGGTVCADLEYTVQFEFRSGRFRSEVLELSYTEEVLGYVLTGPVLDKSPYHKKNGATRKGCENGPAQIAEVMNSIRLGIATYRSTQKNDW